jgi:hypothetical protein
MTSNTVDVNFNNASPETPINYSKTKPDNCTYKITFRTANDSGRTTKVVLYRSDSASFTADSDHVVNSIGMGSDADGSMANNISPDCDTTYYYAIRAFDAYGNGSGLTGDNNTTTTVVNPTTVTTAEQGAIPVVGQGEGTVSEQQATGSAKEVLGETKNKVETNVSQNPLSDAINWIFTHKKISLIILVIVVGAALSLYLRFQKKSETN